MLVGFGGVGKVIVRPLQLLKTLTSVKVKGGARGSTALFNICKITDPSQDSVDVKDGRNVLESNGLVVPVKKRSEYMIKEKVLAGLVVSVTETV